jgi:hypothetical protein
MVMSDEQETTIDEDYRFIDYRLNQLETNLRKGQEKLEQEQNNNYKELMHILQVMQEANNEQNKQLIEVIQRQKTVEEKMQCIDKLKEVATKNRTEIHEIERRLEIYKQILFVVGTGVAIALITELIRII